MRIKNVNQYKSDFGTAQMQKLPMSKKNREWREAHVDYVIGASGSMRSSSSTERFKENMDLYLGNFDIKKLKYVVDPYDQSDGFPAMPHNINIVKPKVDLLVGEEINTAVKPTAYCTSGKASEEIDKKKMGDLVNYMLQSMFAAMDPDSAMDMQSKLASGEIKDPREILGMAGSLTYKSSIEESARTMVEYIYERLGVKTSFTTGFFDLLTTGREVFYAGTVSGEPALERVDPATIDYVASSSASGTIFKSIEDAEMICRTTYMTPVEIYDRLYHIAEVSDLDKILALSQSHGNQFPSSANKGGALDYSKINFTAFSNQAQSGEGRLPVHHVLWRSFKKVGFLVYLDDLNIPQSTVVSEDYVKVGNEVSLTWDWIPEIWEGYRIGDDIYIGIQPLPYQNVTPENLLTQKMPYFGIELPRGASLVDSLKPLQYLYIIIWYRLELALAKDKGRILNMDINKIPKSLGIEPEKWVHLLSSVGVNFYNPNDTGFNNSEDAIRDNSNGISGTDLSMSNVIAEYINILERIEYVAEQITGISRQRSGFTKSSEYVGAIQQAIGQSSLVTEPLYWAHEVCKTNVLRYMLNMAKESYYALDKKFLSFITSDGARVAKKLDEGFFLEDYDVFVNSSRKESKDLELVKSLYQAAMQNGTNLSDIASIVSMNSVQAIKSELLRIEEERALSEQAREMREQEAQDKVLQAQAESDKMTMELELMRMDLEKYKIDANNQAKIAVAELQAIGYANRFSERDVTPDIEESADSAREGIAKNANLNVKTMRERSKMLLDSEELKLKSKKLDNEIEVSNKKLKLEKEKLEIERKKLSAYKAKNNTKK